MIVKCKYNYIYILIVCLITSCTKPYNPKVIATTGSFLVVEGTINTGGDSTIIYLSRTVSLNSLLNSTAVTGAVVTIQSNQNRSYSLTDQGNGAYSSPPLNLSNTLQYRLSITTTDGKIYQSAFVPSINTPAIDSLGFTEVSNPTQGTGIQVYVNTHDPNNNTHYYRWDFAETWQFNAKYYTALISNGSAIVLRTNSQLVYQCWGSGISNNINIGSSIKLSQDVIYQNPITFVNSTSEKLETRYSILVKQYALTADAYNYYSILKQNTEGLGSIFDAQPSQLTGNLHCTTDATLPVIGYITAGTVQQKRIYINNSQLPSTWVATYPYQCTIDTAYYENPHEPFDDQVQEYLIPLPTPYIPITELTKPGAPGPIGYTYVETDCADCSIRGTTIKPSFWQ